MVEDQDIQDDLEVAEALETIDADWYMGPEKGEGERNKDGVSHGPEKKIGLRKFHINLSIFEGWRNSVLAEKPFLLDVNGGQDEMAGSSASR